MRSFVVTAKFVTQGQSFRGGWSRRQLEILDVTWPPSRGWRKQVVGREITDDAAKEFLSLKRERPKD